jgi:hypothetical protein
VGTGGTLLEVPVGLGTVPGVLPLELPGGATGGVPPGVLMLGLPGETTGGVAHGALLLELPGGMMGMGVTPGVLLLG